jgi:hypothetical protein
VCCQVDLDERAAAKITDDNGDISKEDFVKIAQDNKLLDFGHVMGGDGMRGVPGRKGNFCFSLQELNLIHFVAFFSPAFSAVVG